MGKPVLGIDPGLNGALVLTDGGSIFLARKVPSMKAKARGRQVDLATLFLSTQDLFAAAELAVIEEVGAMPRQGVSSMFKFGYVTGALNMLAVAHQVPVITVSPRRWKSDMGVSADKDSARYRASQLMPGQALCFAKKSDHGVAEAALLAHWGFGHG